MTITHRTPLTAVAFVIGSALDRAGIEAALTGGACATLHSNGAYASYDLDFVIRSTPTQRGLDQALASIGFRRDGARYAHPDSQFFVEFVPGPLAIGADVTVRPVTLRRGTSTLLALSATDACRDRLAAFYHWRDRGSLQAALDIAVRRRVSLPKIKEWSLAEGAAADFEEFVDRLRSRRAASGRRR